MLKEQCSEETSRIADELEYALEKRQLSLHYQPQFEFPSGNIRGFEALLRWHHPELGSISPLRFIPIAEETGLIDSIGMWVMHQACEKIRQIQKSHLPNSIISVNISAIQLNNPFFFENVMNVLHQTSIAPQYLELELTESTNIACINNGTDTLRTLALQGIKIALDDFGVENNSLLQLQKLPLSTIKIDRSFVINMMHDSRCKIITEWVITLARKLGLIVIAEGVESFEQLHQLRQWECEYIQGYLLSRPLSEQELLLLAKSYL
ncbi:putative bifunctional diguanylate cyclase/phosphodiesterase [Paenibacillus sp. IITD108]|uniref:putative bifunctional diguanylate cyclase/phosphodiesterase n=1 Tax=Paenibacillus sp. IITD108 TaxID=3116649 RepID=UPI002F40A8D2